MQASQLKPASQCAAKNGVKAILYGQPGTAKTPMINTAPRPVLLACEAGLLSMRNSNVPTWEAYTAERIDEFFKWFFESKEAAQFDTLAIDSGSQMAEIYLTIAKASCKDGRKAYGVMAERCMLHFERLYFLPQKHIVLICKEMKAEVGKQIVQNAGGGFSVEMTYQAQPYFPGKELNIQVPHRYDAILHAGKVTIPGQPQPVNAIRTAGTAEILARDRSGRLAEVEPPDLAALFKKAMS